MSAPAARPASGPGREHADDEAAVVTATGAVSLLNYGYTLILLWLLSIREFAEAASVSAACRSSSGRSCPS